MEFNGNQRKLLQGVTRSASSLLIMLSVALIPYSAAFFLGLQSREVLTQRILAFFFPSKTECQCGSLNEISPIVQAFENLPQFVAVWEGLGGVPWLEKICPRGRLGCFKRLVPLQVGSTSVWSPCSKFSAVPAAMSATYCHDSLQ